MVPRRPLGPGDVDESRRRGGSRRFTAQVLAALADYPSVIRLHRLGHPDEPIHLNPDLILTVEATPDTVVSLTVGTKVLVAERPQEVVDLVRAWRASILSAALPPRPPRRGDLVLVRGAAGQAPPREEGA